jgi:hypothetical protein
MEMTTEHLDRVVRSYFTALSGMGDVPVASATCQKQSGTFRATEALVE